jgi:(1->4)-alpha-D-glucan 1-alpha-D-glucosylmutase
VSARRTTGDTLIPSPGTPGEGEGGGSIAVGRSGTIQQSGGRQTPPQPSPGVPGEGGKSSLDPPPQFSASPREMCGDSEAFDEFLRDVIDRARSSRNLPESTYRLQFHAGFTFRDATAIIPYLSELGVTHVYASPYFKAIPGSTHGYDVIDHCQLNPELGTSNDFEQFLAALRNHKMAHIADMVPNHVGIATNENVWWNDVLENGPASLYAGYFDINWTGSPQSNLAGRVLIATLGSKYGDELEQGTLHLSYENGGFFVEYHDRRFPVSPRTYPAILGEDSAAPKGITPSPGVPGEGGSVPEVLKSLLKTDEKAINEYRWILEACTQLPDRCEGSAVAVERHRAKQEIKIRLAKLIAGNDVIREFIAQQIKAFNGTPGDAASFNRLDDLLRHQCFRLAFWRTAPDEINYRRFFDINDLAALAMERPEVFTATHGFVLNLLVKRQVAGLRIDHPDGLYDPRTYFRRLQKHYILALAREAAASFPLLGDTPWETLEPLLLNRLERWISDASFKPSGPPLYVLGEKILALDETLPESWPIDGTSGYEFLNMTNGLFVNADSAGAFDEIYRQWTGCHASCADLVYQKKKLILKISLASELNMLAADLKRIAERSRYGLDFSFQVLHTALKEVIACFPVYRSYIDDRGASPADVRYIDQAIACALERNPKTDASVFKFIRDTVLVENGAAMGADELASQRHFAGKFQQLSSPVMAKGVEDTVFYIYNRLLSLNEVGGDPARFGISPQQLHAFFERRQRDWPRSMSTLSTHDTKRSEDVRARLNVLSEMPERWKDCLERWGDMNAPHRVVIDDMPMPSRNDEYALYQSLLGAWPFDSTDMKSFKERVQGAMQKSMREAKTVTSWIDPDQRQESAMRDFIEAILDDSRAGEFLKDFRSFQRTISQYGVVNSLSQTLLKLTAPGVPDTYQGNEILDFSLVDPDNRRPVDFVSRRALLEELRERSSSPSAVGYSSTKLAAAPDASALKFHIHQSVLKLQKQYPGLFTTGEYLPLRTGGSKAAHIFAFARSDERCFAIIAIPRLIAGISKTPEDFGGHREIWADTYIELPEGACGRDFRNLLTNTPVRNSADASRWLAADLIADCPVALLIAT